MEFGFSEEQEDGYLLNGSKLFNAGWLCTHIFAMAKTDWKITPGHKGITNFLVDLTSPGVTVTPDLTHGGAKRSEVALEDVKVPKDAIIGKKGGGFYMEVAGLAFERLQYVGGARAYPVFKDLVQFVKETPWEGKPLSDIPDVRYKLAEIATEIEVARLVSYQAAWLADKGEPQITNSSMSWLNGNESFERFANAAMDILGERGLPRG
ncbi:MAG: acyl-CoA dehydrogenase [Thermodesulfobacteriota bacterium]|nr:acyl-CoA dehydrogenase [Thermodesulfobacteriota bacterium]